MRNHHFGSRCLLAAVGALPLTFLACGGDATAIVSVDSGTDGASAPDTGSHKDAAKDVTSDTGSKETGAKDTGTGTDTGVPETGPSEAGGSETGPGDTGADAVAMDTGSPDTGIDSGVDAGHDAGHDAGMDSGVSAAVCGNGKIEGNEQCDDGNLFDLDGCDSNCNYEMVTRMTAIAISQAAGPAFCVHKGNALGSKAIASLAIGDINTPLQTDVTAGTVNVFTQFLALSDLTGTAASGFQIGVTDGTLDPAKGTWPAAGNPIDWWFLEDPTTVSDGLPTGLLSTGALVAHALTAGPSNVNLVLNLAGSPANLAMLNAKVSASIGAATDVPAAPPAALAAGLTVFETVTANGTGQGLCGDITVASLAQIPIPQTLTTGTAKCTANYTYCGAGNPVGASCNSLLDALVGGCKVLGGLATAINATQPDVPPSGTATVVPLTASTTTKKVTLPAGNDGTEAYSSYLQFAANRAHFTGEYCTATSQCQTGQTCTAGACK